MQFIVCAEIGDPQIIIRIKGETRHAIAARIAGAFAQGGILLEYFGLSLPAGVALVWFATWITAALTRSKTVERVLNWGFAGVFATFAGVILSAQARHA